MIFSNPQNSSGVSQKESITECQQTGTLRRSWTVFADVAPVQDAIFLKEVDLEPSD